MYPLSVIGYFIRAFCPVFACFISILKSPSSLTVGIVGSINTELCEDEYEHELTVKLYL